MCTALWVRTRGLGTRLNKQSLLRYRPWPHGLSSSEYIIFPSPSHLSMQIALLEWSHNHRLSAFCTASKQNVWSRPRNWADLAILTNSSHWSCLVVHFQLYAHRSLYTHQRTLLLIRRPPSVFITSPKLLLTTLAIRIIYNIIFVSQ